MKLSTFALLTWLAAAPFPAAAVPPHKAQCPDGSLWRKASNYIFRTIWNWEDEKPSNGIYPNEVMRNGRGVSGKILASYGDDVVLRFRVGTEEEASSLVEAVNTLFLDVWEFNTDWVDIRIAKDVVPSLLGLLPKSLRNAHKPLFNGVSLAEAIADTYPSTSPNELFTPVLRTPEIGTQRYGQGNADQSINHGTNRQQLLKINHASSPETSSARRGLDPFFQDYQPLSVITPWMRLMASMFPTHVRMINIGITYEGRDIPALRIGVHPTNKEAPLGPRRTIVITGGSHAREWIGTSSVTYVAWRMITSYGKSVLTKNLLEAFDWVFIPTLNPDGYVFSWENDRLWRKNRQPTSLRFCRGVDLDRSFSYMWDGESSTNPCSESFAGEAPFDGIEAKRFADWAWNETEVNNVKFEAFLDLHSYSQQVLYPYSFSCSEAPPTLEDLEELALGLAKAMRQFKGHNFKATSACEGNVVNGKKTILPRIETGGGSALDWFYHNVSSYAFQIKLRDTGNYGFLLPKENIVPSGKEVLNAVEYLGKFLLGEVGLGAGQDGAVKGQTHDSEHTSQQEASTDGDAGSPEHSDLETDDIQWELRRRRRR